LTKESAGRVSNSEGSREQARLAKMGSGGMELVGQEEKLGGVFGIRKF